MSRDWDKLRRYDRARKSEFYLPVVWKSKRFQERRRRHWVRTRKAINDLPLKQPPITRPKPPLQRILQVTTPDCCAHATFLRQHNQWRCIQADPPLDWFVRIAHIGIIETWLWRNNYRFQWLKATPACTASVPQAEDRSSVPKYGSPAPSLNNDSPPVHTSQKTASCSGQERNGLTSASPLNSLG